MHASREGVFCTVQPAHILRQHTAQSNRLLYHLRPAACRRRLSRRHHEITLVGDGTLRFLGLRSLAPTAVSAASMTLFGPSWTTSGAGNATVSAVPSITLAFAAASRLAIISLMNSMERSICSSVMALMPPECSTRKSRGHNNVNSLQ